MLVTLLHRFARRRIPLGVFWASFGRFFGLLLAARGAHSQALRAEQLAPQWSFGAPLCAPIVQSRFRLVQAKFGAKGAPKHSLQRPQTRCSVGRLVCAMHALELLCFRPLAAEQFKARSANKCDYAHLAAHRSLCLADTPPRHSRWRHFGAQIGPRAQD